MTDCASVKISFGDASNRGAITRTAEVSFADFARGIVEAKPKHGKLSLSDYSKLRALAKSDAKSKEQKAAKATCDQEKAVAGWYCPASFTSNRRRGDDFVSAGVATLDFDSGTMTAEIIRGALKGLRYVALTTYSNSPVAEMWRVHVALSEPTTTREQHAVVVKAIYSRFPSGHPIDERSYLPEQFYWAPSCPADAVDIREAFGGQGEPFAVASAAVTAAAVVPAPTPQPIRSNDGDAEAAGRREELAWLFALIGLEDAAKKLSTLDGKDIGTRDAWVKVGLGAKAYEPTAREEFISWSRTQVGYKSDADCETQWESYDKSKTEHRVTIATLRMLAGVANVPVAKAEEFEKLEDTDTSVSPGFAAVRKYNAGYFVTELGGLTLVCHEETDGRLKYRRREEFIAWHAPDKIEIHSKPDAKGRMKVTSVKAAARWLEWQGRRTFDRVVLKPNGDAHPGEYNLWRGFAVTPKRGDCHRFKAHIREIICSSDGHAYDFVMHWLARMVQKPGERAEVAILLQGEEGIGKGRFAQWIAKLFPPANFLHATGRDDFAGRFNALLEGRIFLFADEAAVGRWEDADRLKRLVTEETICLEQKGLPRHVEPNLLHIIAATNQERFLPTGVTARRYCLLHVSSARREDRAYFDSLDDEMKHGGLEALLFELLNTDISKFDHRHAPRTKALTEQKEHWLSGVPVWLQECLGEGQWAEFNGEWPEGTVSGVKRSDLYEAYRAWRQKGNGEGVTESSRWFWPAVKEWIGGEEYRRQDADARKDGSPRMYALPSRAEAEAAFNVRLEGGKPASASPAVKAFIAEPAKPANQHSQNRMGSGTAADVFS